MMEETGQKNIKHLTNIFFQIRNTVLRDKDVVKTMSEKKKFSQFLRKDIRMLIIRKSIFDCYTIVVPVQNLVHLTLVHLTLDRSNISFLPKEFDTLFHLQYFELMHNYLGKSIRSTWEWLESPIRNNLLWLNISHNFLTKLPLQIICLKNITNLNLSNNGIVCLPIEFGTLPLTVLDLSHNYLGKFVESSWTWLEQTPIKNNLLHLNICHNFLTELPLQIGKLNILLNLFCDQNMLEHLPQNLGNSQSLRVITLSKNLLSYLPGSIVHLNLNYLNVQDNPFVFDNKLLRVFNISHGWKVLSLFECSAKLILNFRIKYDTIPNVLIRYLDETKYCCVCTTACLKYDLKLLTDYFLYDIVWPLKFLKVTENYFDAMFECYTCSPRCTRSLYTIWNPYIKFNFYDNNSNDDDDDNNDDNNNNNDDNEAEMENKDDIDEGKKENENEDDSNEERKGHEYEDVNM